MPDETPPATTSPNAPAFVPTADMDAARENARLTSELAKERTAREAAETRAKSLEGAVDEKQQKELAAERDALKAENEKLKADGVANSRKAELAGKVADVDAALALLDADKHIKRDGTIDVEAFLKDRPFLTPAPAAPPAPTAPDGGGGTQTSASAIDMDKAVASGDVAAINAAFDAALAPKTAAK